MTRLSEPSGGHYDVAWSPDSRHLLFSGGPSVVAGQIFSKAADGSGAATVLTPAPGGFPESISADGKYLVFHRGEGLMVQPLDPPAPARPLLAGPVLNAVFSPIGGWIAYQSFETGRPEVYVHPFPEGGGGRIPVSSGGGRYPLWSRDGRELFFIDAAGFLTAVAVDSRQGFAAGPPRRLFRADQYNVTSISRPFDIAPDGKRFVFAKTAPDAERPTIQVVTNWLQEVAAKVGAQQPSKRQ